MGRFKILSPKKVKRDPMIKMREPMIKTPKVPYFFQILDHSTRILTVSGLFFTKHCGY